MSLRVKDIDFGFDKIYIWDSKSLSDRVLPLPKKLKTKLLVQVEVVKELHAKDLADGYGSVYMPYTFEKKYPNASKVSKDPRSKIRLLA